MLRVWPEMEIEFAKALPEEAALLSGPGWNWEAGVMAGPDRYDSLQAAKLAEQGWVWKATESGNPLAFAVVKENRASCEFGASSVNWATLISLVPSRAERGMEAAAGLIQFMIGRYAKRMKWETWLSEEAVAGEIYLILLEAGFYDDGSVALPAVQVMFR